MEIRGCMRCKPKSLDHPVPNASSLRDYGSNYETTMTMISPFPTNSQKQVSIADLFLPPYSLFPEMNFLYFFFVADFSQVQIL